MSKEATIAYKVDIHKGRCPVYEGSFFLNETEVLDALYDYSIEANELIVWSTIRVFKRSSEPMNVWRYDSETKELSTEEI